MFFQVSPPTKQIKPKKTTTKEPEEISILSLAPFTCLPKLSFDDVPINTIATKTFIIRNPTPNDIKLFVTKIPIEERRLKLSWYEEVITANEDVYMEMQWSPDVEGCWRETITFQDGGRLRKDISVNFKCMSIPKQKVKTTQKRKVAPAVVCSKVISPIRRRISPKIKIHVGKNPRRPLPDISNIPIVVHPPYEKMAESMDFLENKENFSAIHPFENVNFSNSLGLPVEQFDDSLENNTPRANKWNLSECIEEKFKKFAFSPSTIMSCEVAMNLSGATYVKDNSSFATYTKDDGCNISSSTCVKDSTVAIGSPKSTITNCNLSPIAPVLEELQNKTFEFVRPKQPLDLIMEESGIVNNSELNQNCTMTFKKGCSSSPLSLVSKRKQILTNKRPSFVPQNNLKKPKSLDLKGFLRKAEVRNDFTRKKSESKRSVGKDSDFLKPFQKKKESSYLKYPSDFVDKGSIKQDSNFLEALDSRFKFASVRNKSESNEKESNVESRLVSDSLRGKLESEQKEIVSIKNKLVIVKKPLEYNFLKSLESQFGSGSTSKLESSKKESVSRKNQPDFVEKQFDSKRIGSESFQHLQQTPTRAFKFKPVMYPTSTKAILESTQNQGSPVQRHQNMTKIIHKIDPFFFASNSLDPFMSQISYYDLEWVDKQEQGFQKWLNALLTPPIELKADVNIQIDVAKLWQDCKKRDVSKAPSKESLSSKYHNTKSRLDSLRNSAFTFVRSEDVSKVFLKLASFVKDEKLSIRADKDLHLDLSLQAEIMTLFFSYNPLWLRIGLETVYGVIIPLNSNSDILGLGMFISEYYFKDSYLLRKYKSVHSPKYTADIKKFMLKKFLVLIYFLDHAKSKQLIPHNPCLFSKKAPYKESRDILLKFSRELLFAVGDVTKYLKHVGYVLTHKQTYIDEFDYAVNNMGIDLRDGVRLTRIMEIILLQENLTANLRVPAISRLQKIHNVKIVFDALYKAGFTILYDISPKDLVDGHKEKTLSFLWQIIYKFQAPRLNKAVTIVQKWWRSLPIIIMRNKLRGLRRRKEEGAVTLQRWYRNILLARKFANLVPIVRLVMLENRMDKAALKIQAFFKMILTQKRFITLKQITMKMQSYSRRWLVLQEVERKTVSCIRIQAFYRMHRARKIYLLMRQSVLNVQQRYRANCLAKIERENYKTLKVSCIFLQRKFRAILAMKKERHRFVELRKAIVLIQVKYRANKSMQIEKNNFQKLKMSAVVIQRFYRSYKLMRRVRLKFLEVKKAVKVIEVRYLAQKQMKRDHLQYQKLKMCAGVVQDAYRRRRIMLQQKREYDILRQAVIFIQRKFRANRLAKIQRECYVSLKKSVLLIEDKYIAKRLMIKEVENYTRIKNAVKIVENCYLSVKLMRTEKEYYEKLRRSVIFIQEKFRSNRLAKIQRENYNNLRTSCIFLQRKVRAVIVMKKERHCFVELRKSVVFIQNKYRAKKSMQIEQNNFQRLKMSAVVIQRFYRSYKVMRQIRSNFLEVKKAVKVVEVRYLTQKQMKRDHLQYQKLKMCAGVVQDAYRRKRIMLQQKREYDILRQAVIFIQRKFRANRSAKIQRECYVSLKKSVLLIEDKYIAKRLMIKEVENYTRIKNAVKIVENCYLSVKLMRTGKEYYEKLRRSVIFIQEKFRSNRLAKIQRENYNNLRTSCIFLQRKVRAVIVMKKERHCFVELRKSVVFIQNKYRAKKSMQIERNNFQRLKMSAVVIQKYYRSYKVMRQIRSKFLEVKTAVKVIEVRYLAQEQMKKDRIYYQNLRKCTVFLQNTYRGKIVMLQQKREYDILRQAVIFIQRKFRANRLAKIQRECYVSLKKSVLLIEDKYIAKRLMIKEVENYTRIKNAVKIVENCYLSVKLMRTEKEYYEKLRQSVIFIQEKFRSNRLAKIQRECYKNLRTSCIFLQRKVRAIIVMKKERHRFVELQESVIFIQNKYRAKKSMQIERNNFQKIKNSATKIQRWYRKMQEIKKFETVTVTVFQAYCRGKLSRKTFRERLPFFIEQKRQQRTEWEAAIKIQALWRGYTVRLREENNLAPLRMQVDRTNNRAIKQDTLGERRQKALDIIMSDSVKLNKITEALKDLEFITRHCKTTCIEMSEYLPEILYTTISSTSRSEADQEACAVASSILINFCKLSQTIEKCWYPDYIDDIVTKMMHSCDKNTPLFVNLCTLLYLFSFNERYKIIIQSVPNFKQRMTKIKILCKRKEKMMLKSHIVVFSYFEPYKELPLPSRDPDWGIHHKDRPRTFTNSPFAIRSLFNVFKLL